MSTTFWSGDYHWGHSNVLRFDNRPFTSIEEHDEALIDNHNKRVSKKDTIYILGDSVLKREFLPLLSRLNGHKHYILGNHCRRFAKYIQKYCETVSDYTEIKIDGQNIVMSHYPMLSFNKSNYGSWMLHAHCHGNIDEINRQSIAKGIFRYDVGVVNNGYEPVSFEELKVIFNESNNRK